MPAMRSTHFSSAAGAAAWLRAAVGSAGANGTLCSDSRQLRPGDALLAWPGASSDGRVHVAAALAAGAAACLVEAEGVAAAGLDLADPRVGTFTGLKSAAGHVAAAFFGHPGPHLRMLAVTGTNGKTSTALWLAQALATLGQPCGVIGTLGVGTPQALQATGLTTPEAVRLHAALRGMVDQGLVACAMEASSIGLAEGRLAALPVHVALFTNLTQDHLDYHGSMAAYWAAKQCLFAWPGLQAAVINIDDAHGAELATRLQQQGGLELWTVSLHDRCARLHLAEPLRHAEQGLVLLVREGNATATLHTTLLGTFNASNLLGVLAALRALGHPLHEAAAAAQAVQGAPGRMQRVPGSGADSALEVLVDYAHTPDALDQALQALRPLAQARSGRLGVLFGCGGNRDASKRPLMGRIASQRADVIVLSSDNPRHEDPLAILAQIESGLPAGHAFTTVADRAEAIAHTLAAANDGDVWLLAGKGHEDTQEVAGVKRPFSDIAHAQAALQLRASRRIAQRLAPTAMQATGAAC